MARKPLKHYHVTVSELGGPVDYREAHRSARSAELGMQAKVDQLTQLTPYARVCGSMRSGQFILYRTEGSRPTLVEMFSCENPTCTDDAGAWMSLF